MKAKSIIVLFAGFICYFMLRIVIFPYDNKQTHPTFNQYIIKYLEQNVQSYFPAEYLIKISSNDVKYKGRAVTAPGYFEGTYVQSDMEFTILEWIKHGGFSADEPELAASVRHFYDPLGRSGGRKYLTNRGTYWEGNYPNPQIDAIEWAMGDTKKGEDNNWSLQEGKRYFRAALELADEELKKTNLARAFRCLGEVLHNTADMGCPPHTRNDSHAAPWGYTGGVVLGSPDPNEELFSNNYISTYMDSDPDPELKTFCENAASIRSINEKLAENTNANFFTSQTINGFGNSVIKPINEDGYYPKPLLNELEYDSDEYTYYKVFSNNYKIKMLKDKSFFVFRGYPYIDRECVGSQANVLVPNILCAGSNIVRLFIPKFQIKIASVNSEGKVEGIVQHIPTAEYNDNIDYSGKIIVYNFKNAKKVGELNCSFGDFNETISDLNTGDEIYANLEIAGINIRSDIYKVGNTDYTVTGSSIFLRNLNGNFLRSYKNGSSEQLDGWSLSSGFPKETDTAKVSYNKSNFTFTQEFKDHEGSSGEFFSGKLTMKFSDENLTAVSSFSAEWEYKRKTTTIKNKLSATSIPLDNSVSFKKYKLRGVNVCSNIVSLTTVEEYSTYTYSLIEGSQFCNDESEIEIFISIE